MAYSFQCMQIQTLYKTLLSNGISKSKVQKICTDYAYEIGIAIDQFWIETSDGDKVFPLIAFSKTHPDHNPSEIIMNKAMFSFCEYSSGNSSWFFEENNPDTMPQKYENGEAV